MFYSTTGHGKSTVDAIFGAVKRTASAESLNRGFKNDIIDAEGLQRFLITHINYTGQISPIIPIVVTTDDYEKVRNNEVIKKRWNRNWTVNGTQQHHDFRRDKKDNDFIIMRSYSDCEEYERVRLMKKHK